MGLGSSSGALGDVINLREPLFSKLSVLPRREHDFRNDIGAGLVDNWAGLVDFGAVWLSIGAGLVEYGGWSG